MFIAMLAPARQLALLWVEFSPRSPTVLRRVSVFQTVVGVPLVVRDTAVPGKHNYQLVVWVA